MRKTSILAFLLVAVISLGFVQRGIAQSVPVNLNLQNVPLEKVLAGIEKQTNYLFVYNKNINVSRLVSVNADQKSIKDVLAQLLNGTDITFSVEGTNIILSQKTAAVSKGRAVEGKVTDQSGAALPGVSVSAKGGSAKTVTDANGEFTLSVDSNIQTLQFTYVGMEPQDVAMGSTRVFAVTMSEQTVKVTEVVVTAMGLTKDKKSLSYDVQSVAADEVLRVKDASFVTALAGKIAGASINASSSGVGGSSRVVMRGTKSLGGENNALYVIDGIPMPNLSTTQSNGDMYSGAGQSGDGIANINPEDIESMTALTGPSACALYGSEGANGVILITTKRGLNSDFKATYTNSTTFFSPFVMPRFQNTYGVSETGSYSSWGDKLETPSSYKPKDFFRTGFNETNAITVSGGTDRSQTFISAASVNAKGIIHNNDLNRYNFSLRNTSYYLNDKLTIDAGFMYSTTREQNMISQGQYSNPLLPIYLFPAGDDIRKYEAFERYNPERFFKTQFWPFGDQGYGMQNPYWITERNMFQNDKDRYMITLSASYKITGWLDMRGRAKIDNDYVLAERKFYASTWKVLASDNGYYSTDDYTTKRKYADLMLSANKTICHDYSLSANVGTSIEDTQYAERVHGGKLAGIGSGIANQFSYANISQDAGDVKFYQNGFHDQMQSLFGTAQFGYKNMLYVDLSGRFEWPSALAYTSQKSYFYSSVGLSAVLTDLLNIKSSTLSFLKLRGSYGEVGTPPRRWVSNPSYEQPYGRLPYTMTDMPFDIRPERTKSWEAGFNLAMWGNRVKLDATVYKSNTYNQIVNGTLPASSGYTGFYINSGNISNRGIEATLSVRQPLGPVLWNSAVVFSLNRNKVEQLIKPGQTDPLGNPIKMSRIDLGGNQAYHMFLTQGGTMADLYVNKLRTDEHGNIYVNPTDMSISVDPSGAQTYAGRMSADYTLSWRNGLSWKGVDLNFMISARVGGVGLSLTQAMMDGFGASQASAQARDGSGVLVNGYNLPAYNYYSVVGSGQGVGSMYIYDATNVRLSELSIGYSIPLAGRVSKYIKGVNVAFVGRNLLMIYNKAPFDPESTATTGTYFTGIDYFMQPSLRNLGFSVKLTF